MFGGVKKECLYRFIAWSIASLVLWIYLFLSTCLVKIFIYYIFFVSNIINHGDCSDKKQEPWKKETKDNSAKNIETFLILDVGAIIAMEKPIRNVGSDLWCEASVVFLTSRKCNWKAKENDNNRETFYSDSDIPVSKYWITCFAELYREEIIYAKIADIFIYFFCLARSFVRSLALPLSIEFTLSIVF